MSSYSLSSPSLVSTYYPTSTHYALYGSSFHHEPSLACVLKESHSTPRITMASRSQTGPLMHFSPITSPHTRTMSYSLFSHTGLYGLPSTSSNSTSSHNTSPPSQPLTERSFALEARGPMLPGAVASSGSMDDLWAYTSGSSPRRRQSTISEPLVSEMPISGLYHTYDAYASATGGYQPPTTVFPTDVASPLSPLHHGKPELPSPCSSSGIEEYNPYDSYAEAPLGRISRPFPFGVTPDGCYAAPTPPPAAYSSLPSYQPPVHALDPRDAYQGPTAVSPSSLAHALSPALSQSHLSPASVHISKRATPPLSYPSPDYASTPSEASLSSDGEPDIDEEYKSDSGSEYNDDEEYGMRSRRKTTRRTRASSHVTDASLGDEAYGTIGPIRTVRARAPPLRMPMPKAIPNLTKKSRGRRVPTSSAVVTRVCLYTFALNSFVS
jgi:hypothetical protein